MSIQSYCDWFVTIKQQLNGKKKKNSSKMLSEMDGQTRQLLASFGVWWGKKKPHPVVLSVQSNIVTLMPRADI